MRSPAATPWRQLLLSRNVWAICAMYFAYGYGLYFYLTWLPTYLVTELGFSALGGGFFASLPFLLAGIADVTGGWLTDRLARRHSLRVARCGVGFTAFVTTAVLLFVSTLAPAPTEKALLLALALGSADLSLSACWAAPLDVAAAHAGVITGFMNTFGNLGGLLCPLVVGWAVERQHSWTLPFYITAVVYSRWRNRLAGDRSRTAYSRRARARTDRLRQACSAAVQCAMTTATYRTPRHPGSQRGSSITCARLLPRGRPAIQAPRRPNTPPSFLGRSACSDVHLCIAVGLPDCRCVRGSRF